MRISLKEALKVKGEYWKSLRGINDVRDMLRDSATRSMRPAEKKAIKQHLSDLIWRETCRASKLTAK